MAKIKEVRAIRTRSCGHWLIVKIVTDQPGLYGIGSVSDYYQTPIVKAAIDEWLAPLLVGRDASRIEDIWQTTYTAAGWRNGALMNTVMSGMDMALWDIKGKEAGLPLYQLLGGACRSAVPCYAHAEGHDFGSLLEETEKYLEEGFPVIRCQIGDGYGGGGYVPVKAHGPKNSWVEGDAFDDEVYLETITDLFEFLRQKLGFEPKLCHDVHEHLRPQNAVALAKRLEPFRLFFLEDALAPEQVHWYRLIREQCTTPQAMGENFVNPHEYLPLGGIHLTGVTICSVHGVSSRWQALPGLGWRVSSLVSNRCGLPGLPRMAAVARRLRLSELRPRRRLALGRWPLHVSGVFDTQFGDGRYDLRSDADTLDDMVHRLLAVRHR